MNSSTRKSEVTQMQLVESYLDSIENYNFKKELNEVVYQIREVIEDQVLDKFDAKNLDATKVFDVLYTESEDLYEDLRDQIVITMRDRLENVGPCRFEHAEVMLSLLKKQVSAS